MKEKYREGKHNHLRGGSTRCFDKVNTAGQDRMNAVCLSCAWTQRDTLCAAFTALQSRETNTDVTIFAEVSELKSRVVFFSWEDLSVALGANCEHHSAT